MSENEGLTEAQQDELAKKLGDYIESITEENHRLRRKLSQIETKMVVRKESSEVANEVYRIAKQALEETEGTP